MLAGTSRCLLISAAAASPPAAAQTSATASNRLKTASRGVGRPGPNACMRASVI